MVQRRVSPSDGRNSSPLEVGGLTLAAIVVACLVAVIFVIALGSGSKLPQSTVPVVAGASPRAAVEAGGVGAAASANSLGQRLKRGLVLDPATAGGPPSGYVVSDRSDPALLSEARLRAGDLVVDYDGLPLMEESMAAFGDELAASDSLELTIIRQGQLRRRTIRLKS